MQRVLFSAPLCTTCLVTAAVILTCSLAQEVFCNTAVCLFKSSYSTSLHSLNLKCWRQIVKTWLTLHVINIATWSAPVGSRNFCFEFNITDLVPGP